MKPMSQTWETQTKKWQDRISCFVDEQKNLKIGGWTQDTVFFIQKKIYGEVLWSIQ